MIKKRGNEAGEEHKHHRHFKFRIIGKSAFEKRREFYEIFFSEMISITGGLVAGLILLNIRNSLEFVPALLILLPGFLELHGNLFGSLAARLSVALHLRKLKPKLNHSKIFTSNIMATVFLAFVVSVVLGLAAYFLTKLIFGISATNIIFISLIAMCFSLILEIPLTIFAVFWFFKKGVEPDDIMGPYVTTLADIISVITILIAIAITI
ncbi:MAG: magnesium transporter [Candidatus Pacearchaeota archaeon]|nr:magnesium transporter [Candidatus Pacearchaeota archaeon]